MSKIKLALDVVTDLRSLADSIETLTKAIAANEDIATNETIETLVTQETLVTNPVTDSTKKKAKAESKTDGAIGKTTAKEVKNADNQAIDNQEEQPTLEELRALMAAKNKAGHREAVKAIILKYGANNLSAMDSKYYAQAMKEVGELK